MRDTFVRRPHSRDVGFMQSNAPVMLIPLVDGELKTATEIKEVAEAPWHFTLERNPTPHRKQIPNANPRTHLSEHDHLRRRALPGRQRSSLLDLEMV